MNRNIIFPTMCIMLPCMNIELRKLKYTGKGVAYCGIRASSPDEALTTWAVLRSTPVTISRHEREGIRKRLVAPELLQKQKDKNVKTDERVIDHRSDRSVGIIIANWEHISTDAGRFRHFQ